MHTRNAALFLGAILSTGLLMAQAPDPSQTGTATQTQPDRQHRMANPDKQAQHLGKKLGLSGDQVAQIKPILADRQQQMQSLRADASLAPQDRRAKAQAIQQDSKSKIEAVLNDSQKQQFEQMLAERHAHRQHPNAQGGA